eukprot:TRINITY_DN13169_c0_g1_i1.p1 TRINITY_DN13169_c0_g1~~TRINITY_DN13169_c0_g1_i1.p1  ORF type:complete len:107 (-),score=24.18 TRINITY_DN13169_c0_g1_i1:389-661(-)
MTEPVSINNQDDPLSQPIHLYLYIILLLCHIIIELFLNQPVIWNSEVKQEKSEYDGSGGFFSTFMTGFNALLFGLVTLNIPCVDAMIPTA